MTIRAGPATLGARMLDTGSVVAGRYRVEGELGRGGMGRVLLARHLVLGERVALKIVATDEERGDAPRERLLREARAAARLRSDYAVRVLDVLTVTKEDDPRGGDAGALCLVLEHIGGPTLAREIAARGPLPVDEAITLVLQIAVGLSEAHACGIVHRDLKPANVLLATLPSGRRRPRLIDFGIAKATIAASNDATLTGDGVLLGSPVYMAPEQITDAHGVDARADVWSLGVLLFELLTGGLPFEGLTTAGLLARIERERPRSPAELRSDLPAELALHVLRCLEKDPAGRFADLAALGRALAPFSPEGAVFAEEIAQTLSRAPIVAPDEEPVAAVVPGSLTATDEPPSNEPSAAGSPADPPLDVSTVAPTTGVTAPVRRSLAAPIVSTVVGLALLGAFMLGRGGRSRPGDAIPASVASVRASAEPSANPPPPSASAVPVVSAEGSASPAAARAPSGAPARKVAVQKEKVVDEVALPDVLDRLGSRK